MTKHDWKVGERARIICVTENDIKNGVKAGDIVTIAEEGSSFPWCELSDGRKYPLHLHRLKPLPAETPKNPFAPGEYVTCVVAEGFHGKHKGDVLLVDRYVHPDKDWFCSLGWSDGAGRTEALGFQKRCFRPATPEEIAAYKAKYEAEEPKPICASDADLSITAPECSFGEELIPPQPSVSHNSLAGSVATFGGKTYILRDPAARPTIEIAGVVYELEEL